MTGCRPQRRSGRLILLPAALLLLAPLAANAGGDSTDDGVPFVGVFHPIVTGFSVDPIRCPDASHPLALTFTGEADTTLGHVTFTQSHCEDFTHTSFRRGLQVITIADGSQLSGTYHGQLLPTPTTAIDGKLIIDGVYRNTGGTGTLSKAHGMGISAGVVDTTTGAAEVAVSGTL